MLYKVHIHLKVFLKFLKHLVQPHGKTPFAHSYGIKLARFGPALLDLRAKRLPVNE